MFKVQAEPVLMMCCTWRSLLGAIRCDRDTVMYSCGQSKSSNLQTDFLGLRKASELVDNCINEFLLMSFINSNEQNFQK